MLHSVHGREQVSFAGAWSATTLIDTAYGLLITQDYGAARDSLVVFCMTNC
jgi:hypothetical protein